MSPGANPTANPTANVDGGDGEITWLRHNRIDLALHRLSIGSDPSFRPLLILHGLGERTPRKVPDFIDWPGPVFGLDFTGHGRSTVPLGGGYTSEVLTGDVDSALAHLGAVTILGKGLGAYVALLITAARPDQVLGAVLTDGPGLAGGGVQPGSPSLAFPPPWSDGTAPDPLALLELSRDVRPPDYAQNLVRLATDRSELDKTFVVSAVARPEWLKAIATEPGVGSGSVREALELFSQ
ncbi:MAG: alpha/beta hydrolase [Microthrixaceae bacterium]